MAQEERLDIHYFSTTPKNSWELLKWIFSEPVKVEKFSEKISQKNAYSYYMKIFFMLAILGLLIHIFIIYLIASLGTESFYSFFFDDRLADFFNVVKNTSSKFILLFKVNGYFFIYQITLWLIFGILLVRFKYFKLGITLAVINGFFLLFPPMFDGVINVYSQA